MFWNKIRALRAPEGQEAGGSEPSQEGTQGVPETQGDGGESGEGQEEGGEAAAGSSGEATNPSPAGEDEEDHSFNPTPKMRKRIDKLTKNWREAEERERKLQAELEELRRGRSQGQASEPGAQVTPEELAQATREAEAQARGKSTSQAELDRMVEQRLAEREMARRGDAVVHAGREAFSDFDTVLGNFKMIGGLQAPLAEVALEMDDPSGFLYHLAQDPDAAEEMQRMSPARMALAAERFEAKRKVKAAARKVSSAPPPAAPIVSGGRKGSRDLNLDASEMPIDEWMKMRNEQVKARRGR